MLQILRTTQFKRDVSQAQRRNKDIDRLKRVIVLLAEARPLPARCRDHQLRGAYRDCRECHIEPDWLLVYRVDASMLQLVRTGSHSDLFE